MDDLFNRKLTPEILDSIPHDDPGAIQSRRDLSRINRFMGSESWILRNTPENPKSITEIGSGDGHLLAKLAKAHPGVPITAYDLAPRPAHLPEHASWIQGDLFTQEPDIQGGTLIANLFLHHFTDEKLRRLRSFVCEFDTIISNEPRRNHVPLFMAKMAHPFIHPITRHDMRVSIEAGFRHGELPAALGLSPEDYVISEATDWRGSIRMIARKTSSRLRANR
jgi:hypothetical protein